MEERSKKRMIDYYSQQGSGPKITVIGGGTGLSVILRGMKKVTEHLTAIVTVADDGGGSGILREDLGMLSPGDVRSCLLAMADEEGTMQELLKYRFCEGRYAGQSFGNLLLAALDGIYGNFETAVSKASEILRVRGCVLPVTTQNVTLCAELENGEIVYGESRIPAKVISEKSRIHRVFLKPENSDATKAAIRAILESDVIVFGPGSLYSSIIVNFLVGGIREAIQRSCAQKILICNIMTQPGETDNYTVSDHVNKVNEYIGREVIEYVIANNKQIEDVKLQTYKEDGARQILPTKIDKAYLKGKKIRLIENNFTDIKMGYIRHDAERIANLIVGLTHEY
ncbi:gluconeogenesis factor YvcK family protein [Sinanaerobacter sp. ZZT-01]|uniref:gluconeogenesis factor YvcK family protein n=1 Tax=Sinanaerobacter sp. ZZT-01 TaxID=3111540 RepID=UPI002D765911|nr:gluconeogenesis factor YvcK family protein [Sinanaerobacter sp. ZZT-01]WRR94288.1 gluconeogenesis factor YvcK family protein [Sinanaerobacter sp. ZZT-01]